MTERELIQELVLGIEQLFTAVANGKAYQHEHDKGDTKLAMHYHDAMCENIVKGHAPYQKALEYLKQQPA